MLSMQTPAQMLLARRARRGDSQRGVTMIELSIVLVIAGLLAVAVFLGFQANSRRISVGNNISLITETASELQKKFGATNQYANVTTALAVQSRAIPDELRLPGTNTAQNSYGGQITVLPNGAGLTQANDSVIMTWGAVKQNECIDLVIGVADAGRRIEVPAGTAVKPTDGALNLATLATQCELANNTDVVLFVGRN